MEGKSAVRMLIIFILIMAAASNASFAQEISELLDGSNSPNGKFALGIAGVADWRSSEAGAKGVFLIDSVTRKRLTEIVGFQGWHGGDYPSLELLWSPDSQKLAVYRELRKSGNIQIYSFIHNSFKAIKMPAINSDILLRASHNIKQPWAKFYRMDGEWFEMQSWSENQDFTLGVYGDLLGSADNTVYFSYHSTLVLSIKNDQATISNSKTEIKP